MCQSLSLCILCVFASVCDIKLDYLQKHVTCVKLAVNLISICINTQEGTAGTFAGTKVLRLD